MFTDRLRHLRHRRQAPAAPYVHVNRATLIRDGTNEFIVGVNGWVSGTDADGTLARALVTFDGQTWRTIRTNNFGNSSIVYHFTVSGSNIYTLETDAQAKLTPLGDPAPNAPKWFAAVEIIQLAADRVWLHKSTKEMARYWRSKRERRHEPSRISEAAGDLRQVHPQIPHGKRKTPH